MSKKILKVEYDFQFILIGIISSLKDYRLAHFINKQLAFDFRRETAELKYINAGASLESFTSFYSYSVEESKSSYFFFPNRGSEGHIIPENKEIDFFLMNADSNQTTLARSLIDQLNKIERVERAFRLDPAKLKSRENLLFT